MVESLGYTVAAVAESGEEAIKKAEETHPDLVLMDIMLGRGMDGVQAAEQINTRFNIPVVYVTAHGDDTILQRAKITKPGGYILKPFKKRELEATIEIALYRHWAEEELRKYREHLEDLVAKRTEQLKSLSSQLLSIEQRDRRQIATEMQDNIVKSRVSILFPTQFQVYSPPFFCVKL
ncbi:MAG: response regulator [Nitrospira sp.]|nr:response regulator [Nitrospira sp.]